MRLDSSSSSSLLRRLCALRQRLGLAARHIVARSPPPCSSCWASASRSRRMWRNATLVPAWRNKLAPDGRLVASVAQTAVAAAGDKERPTGCLQLILAFQFFCRFCLLRLFDPRVQGRLDRVCYGAGVGKGVGDGERGVGGSASWFGRVWCPPARA
ncbi:hypothetical protein ISCGN_012407 [Ixodes scapularis]